MFSFKRQRRDRLRAIPLPQSWLKIIERNVPFYRCLPEADQRELQGHVQVFLDEKHFEGCRGLQVTDEIRVTIAAQACLLLLHRDTDYYPTMKSILVYPSIYIAHVSESMGNGIGKARGSNLRNSITTVVFLSLMFFCILPIE